MCCKYFERAISDPDLFDSLLLFKNYNSLLLFLSFFQGANLLILLLLLIFRIYNYLLKAHYYEIILIRFRAKIIGTVVIIIFFIGLTK